MIAARRLSKKFGNFLAVDSIDFEIPRGEVVGFLGPNGAGKTTTIRIICGYLRPTSGRVRVDGMNVAENRREVQRRLGYLPELSPLYPEMRVIEYMRFRARLAGVRASVRPRAVLAAMERCRLTDMARRPIAQLSRGYRQRVGLAAALVHEPPLLVLDEPTAGLDPSQIREVRGLVRDLAGRHTILLSTHILGEVELTCDRILMLARGRIRAAGTIDELREAAAGEKRYVVETDGAACEKALASLPGVARVQAQPVDGRWQRITVTAGRRAGDLRESIGRSVAEQGGATRELTAEAPSLERLFVRMVEEVEAASNGSAMRDPRPAGAGETEEVGTP